MYMYFRGTNSSFKAQSNFPKQIFSGSDIAVPDSKEVPCFNMGDWILKESALLFDVKPYNITFTYNIIKLVHLLLFITRKYAIILRETATSAKIRTFAHKSDSITIFAF